MGNGVSSLHRALASPSELLIGLHEDRLCDYNNLGKPLLSLLVLKVGSLGHYQQHLELVRKDPSSDPQTQARWGWSSVIGRNPLLQARVERMLRPGRQGPASAVQVTQL